MTGQPSTVEGQARSTARRPAVHTWQGIDPARLESVRVSLGEARLRASGRLIAAADPRTGAEAFSASFEVSMAQGDGASRLLLRTTTAEHERQISLSRTEDGIWLVDHGHSSQREEFDGSLNVDVPGAVTFTTLPILRLGLHQAEGEFEVPIVTVSLPDLSVSVVRYSYRTVSLDEQVATIALNCDGAVTEVVVDRDGVVVDFPGLARRI